MKELSFGLVLFVHRGARRLMSLSIPRRILVDDEGLHILCLLDITELHPEEIAPYGKSRSRNSEATCPISAVTDFSGSTDTIST